MSIVSKAAILAALISTKSKPALIKSFKAWGVLGIAALAFCIQPGNKANAEVLYDNINAVSGGADPAHSAFPLADSFSTGASSFSLDHVDLRISGTNPTDGGTFSVSLLSDNSGNAGGAILTIGNFSDSILSIPVNTPPPKGGGFGLRLEAGLIDPSGR